MHAAVSLESKSSTVFATSLRVIVRPHKHLRQQNIMFEDQFTATSSFHRGLVQAHCDIGKRNRKNCIFQLDCFI